MKQFKIVGIISLIIFSFFLTDFVTEIAINNNSLMDSIRDNKDFFEVSSVNAVIEDNTIIPGIKGKIVDEIESYLNMKDFGSFNKNYLIYKSEFPEISIENNKDKVIISGNKSKRNITILINNNNDVINYSNKNSIRFTKLVKLDDNLTNKDNVNIESSSKKFKDLNTLLSKRDLNNNICLISYSNVKECIANESYLVKYSIEFNNNNVNNNLSNISNGEIIFINDYLSVENYKLLINYINSKDLKIIYLSDLIKE